jgi:ribosomal protein S18 acetylase RimI-like enzyme
MIRHAKPSEIDKILTITRACGLKMASAGIFQWNESYPNRETLDEDIKKKQLYVLLSEDDELIGCVAISSEKDAEYDEIDWLTLDENQFYIHRLAIKPEFQHQGYARIMMDFAEDLARKSNRISVRLDTFSLNHRNQRFYESRGYKRLGNIFFPNQSDAPFYCYELILNS